MNKPKTPEIKKLVDQILHHKKKYYDGEPEISDEAYDALEEKLQQIDPQNPILHIVGTPEGGKITHATPMLSCQKATDVDEVVKWSKGADLYVGYKIDGFSLSLIYENGRLIQAATRGNGVMGDDVTLPVFKISSIPKTIPQTSTANVRGELFMYVSEFNRIKAAEGIDYSSPRNLAVGTVKQKDLGFLDKRSLEFFAFELLGTEENASLKAHGEILRSWGFNTAEFELLSSPTRREIETLFQRIEQERQTLDFEIDGLIFKYNDADQRASAGRTEHHPRWMIALKFASQGDISVIQDITWQVGRTGVLTPVAELEPVEVMGAVIRRATLHNAEFLEVLGVAEGDTVMVIRSGDVIPKITELVSKGTNKTSFPNDCPSCGSELKREGVNLICTASVCRDRDIQSIRHWVRITDIEGLGPKNIAKLYDLGIIRHFTDLYDVKLTERILVNHLGKNGSKIHASIQEKKELPFHIFLAGLGIESLGKGMAKTLAKRFTTYNDLKNATVRQLTLLEGISDLTASYIYSGLHNPSLGDQLLAKGVEIIYRQEKKPLTKRVRTNGLDQFLPSSKGTDLHVDQEPEANKTIYVTGKVEGLTKKELKKLVEQQGYEWAPLSRKLDLLVIGEKPGTAKLEKARKYGLTVKTWDEFSKELS
ncbi:MAG: NAD-dependent DNA ligase LigA [Candidatus Heimdallarchaeota archaeon]|nr:MAG: NAD-dependent DNA ligase LigA [Candidatus Heimdallarchaeota archaeon]